MKCLTCGNEFIPRQKYCSAKCRISAFRNGVVAKRNDIVTKPPKSNVPVTKSTIKTAEDAKRVVEKITKGFQMPDTWTTKYGKKK